MQNYHNWTEVTNPEWICCVAIAGYNRWVEQGEWFHICRIRAIDIIDHEGGVRIMAHEVVQPEI